MSTVKTHLNLKHFAAECKVPEIVEARESISKRLLSQMANLIYSRTNSRILWSALILRASRWIAEHPDLDLPRDPKKEPGGKLAHTSETIDLATEVYTNWWHHKHTAIAVNMEHDDE